jgi:D-serine deaminase-like pyridoxal phosphate-dependent protein
MEINLRILVDSVEKVMLLASRISATIDLFIEIDTGYFRSGVLYNEFAEIQNIIKSIREVPQFTFAGFLSHTGNTYSQHSTENIISIFDTSRERLVELKNYFRQGSHFLTLSMGDTPSASLANDFGGVNEIRPGNFVFYDVMQYLLGSCNLDDIAVAVYCPVVAKYPERNQIVIYGGGVHLSKEKTLWQGKEIYGLVSIPNKHSFGRIILEAYVESLSQEHGIITMPSYEIEKIRIGDIVAVYPIHSCMTVDLSKEMFSLEGLQIPKYRTY